MHEDGIRSKEHQITVTMSVIKAFSFGVILARSASSTPASVKVFAMTELNNKNCSWVIFKWQCDARMFLALTMTPRVKVLPGYTNGAPNASAKYRSRQAFNASPDLCPDVPTTENGSFNVSSCNKLVTAWSTISWTVCRPRYLMNKFVEASPYSNRV